MSEPKSKDPLGAALAYEAQIATEAEKVRAGATTLTPELFLALWPLLCRAIPPGFIQTVPAVKGKPYESSGVRSLQVLIDRMNNVLTPLWWRYTVEYLGEGELAKVTVAVGNRGAEPLVETVSMGGVNQASTTGNRYKGSETNAAKRAFAQIGPGHEVYLGATDHDPDTDRAAAGLQAAPQVPAGERKLTEAQATRLEKAVLGAGLETHLAAKLRGFGAGDLRDLTVEQATKVYEWATEGAA